MEARPTVDLQRTVKAVYFDWKAQDYPEYGEPGLAGKHSEDHLQFACPGCGRFGAIRVSHPKSGDPPSWDIMSGSLDDVTTLTLAPSIFCTGCCGWHGYLTAGVFAPCASKKVKKKKKK